jgi:hydroxymethylbilane synthase
MNDRIVIGSRGSHLALRQADWAKSRLLEVCEGLMVEVKIIKTSGDIMNDVSLSVIGGQGVFTKEIELALLEDEVDIAVHSLKDLPTILPDGLTIGAITEREDARDALLLRPGLPLTKQSITGLPEKALIGTSSLRRSAQLRHLRSDLVIKDVRGNIERRIAKLDDGEYDAIVLATAGLCRMGLSHRITAVIEAEEMLPAVGQGALAIEVRSDDKETRSIVSALNNPFARLACESERAFLRRLGGGCQMPIAAHAIVKDGEMRLDGLVAEVSGGTVIRGVLSAQIADAPGLGELLAEQLLHEGAQPLLDQLNRSFDRQRRERP